MKEPSFEQHGKLKFWTPPDKEWLIEQYVIQDKAARQIGREIGTDKQRILDWCCILGIDLRSRRRRIQKQSLASMGINNPSYDGGCDPMTQKRECQRAGKPCICEWCGEEGDLTPGKHEVSTPTCSLQLHHKDHNKENGNPDNLVYLCRNCHMVETWMWHLRKSKKAKVSVVNKIITIDFNI